MAGFFITGTDTGVGKTRFASLLARSMISKGVDVKVCKPIATGCQRNSKGVLVSEDTLALSRAAGDKDLTAITPWCFEVPASPALAAKLEGSNLSIEALAVAVEKRCGDEFAIVEGAGGLLCPLTDTESIADLAQRLQYPIIIVARKRPVASKSMAMPIIFFSLLSYSVMATAILILILVRMKTAGPLHPLEYIPDVDGDNPGAKRTKIRFNHDKETTQTIVPAHLRTKIGVAIRVGELEVTPLAVEKATVSVLVSGFSKSEPCKGDSLVLRLKLKNVSKDQTFSPLDYYFNRKWKEKSRNSYPPPFTFVQFGTEKPEKSFFGGPANWLPLALAGSKKSQSPRETVEDENLDKILEPGDEMTAFLCTDGDDSSAQEILNHQGPMLWRLQVRRGLVSVGAKEIPATAVIGVEFGAIDVKQSPAAS